MRKDTYCSYCGTAFPEGLDWPRVCDSCGSTTYRNPLPVAVLLVPVDQDGLLLVRRAIEPKKGQLALPGGFMGLGETWQEAAAREAMEETGVTINPTRIQLFDALSAPEGMLLVFGLAPAIQAGDLPPLPPGDETAEILIVRSHVPLAFPLHDQVAERYWQGERQLR